MRRFAVWAAVACMAAIYATTPAVHAHRFSPDSRFLAFNSNDSGRFQIYVRSFEPSPIAAGSSAAAPGEAPRSQVSTDGGIGGIVWRKEGKELFYLSQLPRQTVMAVEITTAPAFAVGAPRRLLEVPTPIGAPAQLSAVSSPDGQRFVFAVNVPSRAVR
jgi:Tol biopolymer transport system component